MVASLRSLESRWQSYTPLFDVPNPGAEDRSCFRSWSSDEEACQYGWLLVEAYEEFEDFRLNAPTGTLTKASTTGKPGRLRIEFAL